MGHVGPQHCIRIFSPLLKQPSENPKAALLMLFLNAAAETCYNNQATAKWRSESENIVRIANERMPLDRTALGQIMDKDSLSKLPDFVRQASCHDMFRDWPHWFEVFIKDRELVAFAHEYGLKIRSKHGITEPWPCKVGRQTSKKEFDILRASGLTGYEQYVEFERQGLS